MRLQKQTTASVSTLSNTRPHSRLACCKCGLLQTAALGCLHHPAIAAPRMSVLSLHLTLNIESRNHKQNILGKALILNAAGGIFEGLGRLHQLVYLFVILFTVCPPRNPREEKTTSCH